MRLHDNFAGELVFQPRQLGAVLKHFPQQAALRFNRVALLHHQQSQDPV